MGQGLFIKVAQVVAEEFGVGLDTVKITATSTAKVPNTSPTAASAGTDLNARRRWPPAARSRSACSTISQEKWNVGRDRVAVPRRTRADRQSRDRRSPSWPVGLCRPGCRCPRPASTRRRRSTGTAPRRAGRPFYYFAYGAACSEVMVDTHDRRDAGRPRRHPPRRRPVAQPGDRYRPDRGRLRPGHGLAHHARNWSGTGRAAADPRAVDLQDPDRLATCRPISASRCSSPAATARTRSIAPRRSASRR